MLIHSLKSYSTPIRSHLSLLMGPNYHFLFIPSPTHVLTKHIHISSSFTKHHVSSIHKPIYSFNKHVSTLQSNSNSNPNINNNKHSPISTKDLVNRSLDSTTSSLSPNTNSNSDSIDSVSESVHSDSSLPHHDSALIRTRYELTPNITEVPRPEKYRKLGIVPKLSKQQVKNALAAEGSVIRSGKFQLKEQRVIEFKCGKSILMSELLIELIRWLIGDRQGQYVSMKPGKLTRKVKISNRHNFRNRVKLCYECRGFRSHLEEVLELENEPELNELPDWFWVMNGVERSNYYFNWMHKGRNARWLIDVRVEAALEWLKTLNEHGLSKIIEDGKENPFKIAPKYRVASPLYLFEPIPVPSEGESVNLHGKIKSLSKKRSVERYGRKFKGEQKLKSREAIDGAVGKRMEENGASEKKKKEWKGEQLEWMLDENARRVVEKEKEEDEEGGVESAGDMEFDEDEFGGVDKRKHTREQNRVVYEMNKELENKLKLFQESVHAAEKSKKKKQKQKRESSDDDEKENLYAYGSDYEGESELEEEEEAENESQNDEEISEWSDSSEDSVELDRIKE